MSSKLNKVRETKRALREAETAHLNAIREAVKTDTVRDIAAAAEVSPGRISQIAPQRKGPPPK